jgi:hypothetical protein
MLLHSDQANQANATQTFATPSAAAGTRVPGNENDHSFIGMLDSFRGSGGLARAQEVFTMFKGRSDLGVMTLARWMAQRTVLSLEWHADVWVPLFQFELQHMTVKPAMVPVLAVLNPVCTPWELAHWCAQPHRLLDGQSPADALDAGATQVLRAACADRFTLL